MNTDVVLALDPHLRDRLCRALETGVAPYPCDMAALESALGTTSFDPQLAVDLQEVSTMGVSAAGAAAWIRSLSQAAASVPVPDLVWSGPEVPGVHARDTRRVYEELMRGAQKTLWLSTFAFFDGPKAFKLLAKHMDATPELDVKILLNIQRPRGNTVSADTLVRSFAERFWHEEWPGERRPQIFYDPRSVELDGDRGVLHAKSLVVDDELVFITSANMTEAAFDRNYELGLLSHDRALAASVSAHFRRLIEGKHLNLMPVE